MCAITRSPGMKPCTPSPTCLTTPAISLPGEKGRSGLNWYLFWMRRTSGKFTPLAFTDTKAVLCPASAKGCPRPRARRAAPTSCTEPLSRGSSCDHAGIIAALLPRLQLWGYHAAYPGEVSMTETVISREPQYVGFWMRLLAFFVDVLVL